MDLSTGGRDCNAPYKAGEFPTSVFTQFSPEVNVSYGTWQNISAIRVKYYLM